MKLPAARSRASHPEFPSQIAFPRPLRRLIRRALHHLRLPPTRLLAFLASALSALLLFLVLLRVRVPSAPTWRVAVATLDITPAERVWLSGFASRNRTADSTAAAPPLRARVLVLRAPRASPLVLVALDVVGVDRTLSARIRAAVRRRYGLEESRLRLVASHTHSGPVVGGNLAPLAPTGELEAGKIDRYARWLCEEVVGGVGEALRQAGETVIVRFGQGAARMAVNRREVMEKGFDGSRRGETDDVVPVMWFEGEGGEVVAGAFGYAAHATVRVGGYSYSGDYPGHASAALERDVGGVWLFLPGCGGDQNIYPRGTDALAQEYGETLARAARAVVAGGPGKAAEVDASRLLVASMRVALPFAKRLTRGELHALGRSHREADRRAAQLLLRETPHGERTAPSYAYPVSVARLGDVRMAFLGGEPTVGYCALARAAGADWVVGYADDVMGYVATEGARAGREGGERAAHYYGLPAAWAPGVQGVLLRGVREMLEEVG